MPLTVDNYEIFGLLRRGVLRTIDLDCVHAAVNEVIGYDPIVFAVDYLLRKIEEEMRREIYGQAVGIQPRPRKSLTSGLQLDFLGNGIFAHSYSLDSDIGDDILEGTHSGIVPFFQCQQQRAARYQQQCENNENND